MKERKRILAILNYLSKRYKDRKISFDEFNYTLKKLNFNEEANNENLYNFFNQHNRSEVNWEELDLKPFILTFINKIKMVSENSYMDEKLFTNPIDNLFSLGRRGTNNIIEFYYDSIEFKFFEPYSEFLLNLINLDESDLHVYHGAVYDRECYRPEFESNEDIINIFKGLDIENLEILSKIAKYLGKNKLYLDIKEDIEEGGLTYENANSIIELIATTFKNKKNFFNDIFYEYATEVSYASCRSIIKTFTEHFPEGIVYNNYSSISVSYDFFIEFLEKHPNVKTFADLRGMSFIDYHSDVADSEYEYELDWDSLNRTIQYSLDKLLDELVDNEEEMEKLSDSMKEFERMINDLKFKYSGNIFVRQIVDKSDNSLKYKFEIDPDDVDYLDSKLKLTIKNYKPGGEKTVHSISFSDLPRYVTMERLFESIICKLLN